jgi:hypothetical protein
MNTNYHKFGSPPPPLFQSSELFQTLSAVISRGSDPMAKTQEITWQFHLRFQCHGKPVLTPNFLNNIRYLCEFMQDSELTIAIYLFFIHAQWHIAMNHNHIFFPRSQLRKGFVKIHAGFLSDVLRWYKLPIKLPVPLIYSNKALADVRNISSSEFKTDYAPYTLTL